MNPAMPNLLPATPEIFVFSMACVILLLDLFLSDARRVATYWLTQVTLIGAAVLSWQSLGDARTFTFNHMFVADNLASVLKIAIYLVTIFVFAYSRDYLRDRGMLRGEYFVLGLFGVVGMMVMASASHFLTLYLGLELMSLCLYAMIAFQRDSSNATEAAMKYFVLGAIASGMLLYGLSLVYGMTKSLDIASVRAALATVSGDNIVLILGLVFVIAGIAFKLGAVPFHMWVPDVYHGAPTAVTLYIGTAPKLAAFALVARLLIGGLEPLAVSWQPMLVIMALLSMGLGNLLAIAQDNIKRMLAYSSISHMGFFLLGILSAGPNGYGSALFYVLVYTVMSAAAFGLVILLSREGFADGTEARAAGQGRPVRGFEAERIEDFKGLNQRHPWIAFLMLLTMFSMAGVPPLAGFFAKFTVIQAAVQAGMLWVAVAAVLFAVIGAYYYLRVVKVMYFDDAAGFPPVQAATDVRWLLGFNVLSLLVMAPWIGTLMELCRRAIQGLA
jgi:NADH-quinone oxidoreductase subunit N